MSVHPTKLAPVVAALLTASAALAQPSATQLLSLVPPASQIVGGSVASTQKPHRGAFLIFTRANTLDIEDFFSLIGADDSRKIEQVIFAASTGDHGSHPEHSLLIAGHFDKNRIQNSRAAAADTYRGLSIIVVHPFEREFPLIRHDRLLAIIDSHLAVFGTANSVHQEIDRYLDGLPVDNGLVNHLSSLHNQDETWCLISSLVFSPEVLRVMKKLDPTLGEIDKNADTVLFGIHYGRQIEFEYIIDASQDAQEPHGFSQPVERLFNPANAASFLGPDSSISPGHEYRRVLRMSWQRYESWLSELTVR